MNRQNATLPANKYLTPTEATRLRRHLEDQVAAALARGGGLRLRDAVLGLFLIGTALRVSEAVAAVVGDLALDGPRRFVRVRRGKGGKSRDVTVSSETRARLRQYLSARRATGEKITPESPLFPAAGSGRCLSRISAWRSWKRHLRTVGLDAAGRGCHVARHTRACLLYSETKDLRLVSRELGHADIRTTTIYADVYAEDLVAAAEAVDQRLRGQPQDRQLATDQHQDETEARVSYRKVKRLAGSVSTGGAASNGLP